MTANGHPLSSDLLVALHEPDQAASTLEHLEECLACRVRISRLRHASGLTPPSDDSLQRIMEASTPLPDILSALVSTAQDTEPQPNEIWRVGRSEALLVWVRQVFDDGVADVVPLVLDVDLADQETVLVDANATPLAVDTAAMVSLRTHVHVGAFLNKIGSLDIGKDITEVIAATREGRRPSRVRVGPPIEDDDDQRLEYRQALRDLLGELSPSSWLEQSVASESVDEQPKNNTQKKFPPDDIDAIQSALTERLYGIAFHTPNQYTFAVSAGINVFSRFKAEYLDTTILVATLHAAHEIDFPEVDFIIAACQKLTLIEMDADAVAVAIPRGQWPTQLFTTAHMRSAVELPRGVLKGPTATLEGHGLVDTLFKHLEGAMPAWGFLEQETNRIRRADIHQIAARHANASISKVLTDGRRALQLPKRAAWTSIPTELEERVVRFVAAITNNASIHDAFTELALESDND